MEHFNQLGEASLRRVAIVRALRGLGDFLVMTPALRALRAALPQASISLIGLPAAKPLVQRFPQYLDHFVEFPGFPGIPEVPFDAPRFKNWLASSPAQRFDLVLQMHGNGLVINGFVAMLGAPRTAGFYLPGFFCPDPESYLPWPSTEPEVWRMLRLLEFLGISPKGDHLEFPLVPADWTALQTLKAAGNSGVADLPPQQYVVLHPGAYEAERRWSPERFAQVADALASRGLRIVVTGTAAEAETTAAVIAATRAPVVDLTGQTNLGALALLLSHARLLISNDTGVSHLAAALRVPSVVVFLASDPLRWAPQDRRLHRTVGHRTGGQRPVGVAGEIELLLASGRGQEPPGGNGAPAHGAPLQGPPAHAAPCDRRCLRDACRCSASLPPATPPSTQAVLNEAFALLGEVAYAG